MGESGDCVPEWTGKSVECSEGVGDMRMHGSAGVEKHPCIECRAGRPGQVMRAHAPRGRVSGEAARGKRLNAPTDVLSRRSSEEARRSLREPDPAHDVGRGAAGRRGGG